MPARVFFPISLSIRRLARRIRGRPARQLHAPRPALRPPSPFRELVITVQRVLLVLLGLPCHLVITVNLDQLGV